MQRIEKLGWKTIVVCALCAAFFLGLLTLFILAHEYVAFPNGSIGTYNRLTGTARHIYLSD